MNGGLDGVRILITGAGRGLGRSHALHLASQGAEIIIHDLASDAVDETLLSLIHISEPTRPY